VQGDSPARSRDGDLRESAAQAATGLAAQQDLQKCDCTSGKDFRIHPRSEAEALVIRTLDLIEGSRGRITPDTSATALWLSPFAGTGRMTVDQTKGSTA
jgi:hypothetical protein